MPEPEQPNIEQVLEADIEHLATEVKMHQEHPEMQGASGHELIKRSLQTISAPWSLLRVSLSR